MLLHHTSKSLTSIQDSSLARFSTCWALNISSLLLSSWSRTSTLETNTRLDLSSSLPRTTSSASSSWSITVALVKLQVAILGTNFGIRLKTTRRQEEYQVACHGESVDRNTASITQRSQLTLSGQEKTRLCLAVLHLRPTKHTNPDTGLRWLWIWAMR